MSQARKTIVISDTDLHGFSCGVNALKALRDSGIDADIFSHFSTNPNEPASTPAGLALLVQNLGTADLYILDIPVDIRNPKAYIDALVSHARYKGRVIWMDHHGHSQWVDELNRNGVFAVVYSTSYDLSLSVPRMFAKTDPWYERWALVGAVADFDESVKDRISTDLEVAVAEYLDQVYKNQLIDLARALGLERYAEYAKTNGQPGWFARAIVENQIEPERVLEAARSIGRPLLVPRYSIIGDVVYTTELPPQGLAWKTAWKLCVLTGAKVAVLPSYNPRTNQYAIIVARNWRTDGSVINAIEEFVNKRFSGRQIVGHPGARSISLMSQAEISDIPAIARELNDVISTKVYTPSTVRLVNERYVAEALHSDFRELLRRLAEINERLMQLAEQQNKMYQEYLELKRRQVELLERTRESRYD